jgi:hypothetical protein
MEVLDALAAEAIESVESTEFAFHFAPARGIVNALVIGAGVWTIVFAAVALARAIFSA